MNYEEKSREQLLEEIASLRKNYQNYRSLFDKAPFICISIDENGKISDTNEAFLNFLKYSEEEVIGRYMKDFIDLDFLEKFNMFLNDYFDKGSNNETKIKIITNEGKTITSSIVGMSNYEGKEIHEKYYFLLCNNYEKREVPESMPKSKEFLYSLLEEFPAYVCIYSPDLSLKFINKYLKSNFDLENKKYCYEIFHDFKNRNQEPCLSCPVLEVFETQKAKSCERTHINKKTYHVYDFPYKDYDGTLYVIEIGIDITDRKKSQQQLEDNINYIAFLIDNIRNPLSIISGYAEIKIKDREMNKKILNQVDKIEDLIQILDKGWLEMEDTRGFLENLT